MTELNEHLIKLIKLHGPITVSSYMTEVLTNPKYGYYINQDPFGAAGDFITAPEVSQMFGELVGLWFADVWLKMGKPGKVHLIEFGPGQGTLMKDFLRVLKVLPEFLDVIELHFVEASPQLIKIQKEQFKNHNSKLTWHETVKSALSACEEEYSATFIIANEFFDALPIRQFQKGDLGWHERMVTVSETGDGLIPVLSPFPVHNVKLPASLKVADIHSVIEISTMADYITGLVAEHIKNYSGAALFIDYGYTKYRTGETLQAIEKHKYAHIFEKPGHADLSAHVNFKKIIEIIEHADLRALGPVYQGMFLNDMGIEERVKTLTKEARPQHIKDIISALNRLISPDEMGTLFKVAGMISDFEIDVAGF